MICVLYSNNKDKSWFISEASDKNQPKCFETLAEQDNAEELN